MKYINTNFTNSSSSYSYIICLIDFSTFIDIVRRTKEITANVQFLIKFSNRSLGKVNVKILSSSY